MPECSTRTGAPAPVTNAWCGVGANGCLHRHHHACMVWTPRRCPGVRLPGRGPDYLVRAGLWVAVRVRVLLPQASAAPA